LYPFLEDEQVGIITIAIYPFSHKGDQMIRIDFSEVFTVRPMVMSFDGEVLEVFSLWQYYESQASWRCHISFINKIDVQTDKNGNVQLRVLAEKKGTHSLFSQTIPPELADRVNELVAAFQQAKAAYVANG
jgi:hypothetical protein